MKVCVDTNGLYTTQAGVARYIRGLLSGLRRVVSEGERIQELAWEVENFGYRQPARALKTLYRELVWVRTVAPRALRAMQPDLVHSPGGQLLRPGSGIRHVVTLCDLAVLRHPERYRNWQRRKGGKVGEGIARVDRLICISRFTADEAMELLGVPAAKLEVVPLGCDFHPEEGNPPEEEPESEVPSEFFLFVGSLEPGKNLALLREAYELAEAAGRRLPPLVIVGARWEGVPGEGRPPASWHYLGRQSDEVLVWLYRRARALLFPSKYEGFGLPVAEAMSLGCPVICSRIASLPEVAGEAAEYAGQTAEDYLRAMVRLETEDSRRAELIEAGLEQSRRFSWTACARETLGIYRDVLAK